MSELNLPIYEYEPLYRVDLRCDGMVRWTYECMMEKTEVYCEYREFYCETFAMEIKGWWMSKLALDGLMRYEWPQ